MPTDRFDKLIIVYKIFLAIFVGASLVLFNFWVGSIISLKPIEFAYYLAGVIVGMVVIATIIVMLLGLKIVERKI